MLLPKESNRSRLDRNLDCSTLDHRIILEPITEFLLDLAKLRKDPLLLRKQSLPPPIQLLSSLALGRPH